MTCPASDCRSKGIFSFLLLNPRPPLNNKQCCLSRSSPKKLFPLPPFRKQHVKTGERWKEKQGSAGYRARICTEKARPSVENNHLSSRRFGRLTSGQLWTFEGSQQQNPRGCRPFWSFYIKGCSRQGFYSVYAKRIHRIYFEEEYNHWFHTSVVCHRNLFNGDDN